MLWGFPTLLVAAMPALFGAAPADQIATPGRGLSATAVAAGPRYRVRSSPQLGVEARELVLTALARERLERIAGRYFKATGRRLVVTGGTRTPARQAELMVQKLNNGEDILLLYDQQPALEVREAYRHAVAKRYGKQRLVRAVRETIEAQIRRGVYISRHLQADAVDVRSLGMTPARFAAFRNAVAAEPGVTIIDERGATEPHLHLTLG